MKYSEFYSRQRGFEEFKILRTKLNNAIENPRNENFMTAFRRIKEQAGLGDVVAQDVVAYFYRDGVPKYLPENYKRYMYWEILSAAGGNMCAIDKLQFFLGYAYDTIVDDEAFPEIKYRCEIDEYNYLYIIGQAICEQLVEDLGLSAQALCEQTNSREPYLPEYFRDFRKNVDDAIPRVIEKMKTRTR